MIYRLDASVPTGSFNLFNFKTRTASYRLLCIDELFENLKHFNRFPNSASSPLCLMVAMSNSHPAADRQVLAKYGPEHPAVFSKSVPHLFDN